MTPAIRGGCLAVLMLGALLLAAGRGTLGQQMQKDNTTDDGLKWSHADTDTAPAGDVKFHGQFANDTVTVTKGKLPEHEYLEIALDLLILKTWDGCLPNSGGKRTGPDFWSLTLDRERVLVYATFFNAMGGDWPANDAYSQTYPSPVPGDRSPEKTGALRKNTLGFTYPYGTQGESAIRMDATYRLHFVVPHTQASAVLTMRGLGLQNAIDESWGVMNVQITPRSAKEVERPKAEEIAKLFETATGKDAVAANEAFWKLVTADELTVKFLAKNVKPVPVNLVEVKRLAAELYKDDPPKDERDDRVQAVIKTGWGAAMEPLVRDLRVDEKETPPRVEWVLMEIGMQKIADKELRRMVVAARILEAIGTGAASDARAKLFPQSTVEK